MDKNGIDVHPLKTTRLHFDIVLFTPFVYFIAHEDASLLRITL